MIFILNITKFSYITEHYYVSFFEVRNNINLENIKYLSNVYTSDFENMEKDYGNDFSSFKNFDINILIYDAVKKLVNYFKDKKTIDHILIFFDNEYSKYQTKYAEKLLENSKTNS